MYKMTLLKKYITFVIHVKTDNELFLKYVDI